MADGIEQILSKQDYYGIRLESIGGLGANLCGLSLIHISEPTRPY